MSCEMKDGIILICLLQGLLSLHALTFTQTPPSRISKSLGDNVMLKWTYSIAKPSELVRLECGYLNQSRQMTKLMEQFSTEFQPRTTVIGTRFVNRAYIENGALILTNLRAEDNGIYYCIMKVYDAVRFETVTIRSIDTYLSVGGPKSEGRGGISSGTRTTIIAIIVVVVVLVIAFFAFLYFRKRDRNKSKRTPKFIEEPEDEKTENGNYVGNGTLKEESKPSERRPLTSTDVEIVANPMEAVDKQEKQLSYSSHTAYEKIENASVEKKSKESETWPDPPPSRVTLSPTGNRSSPPSRAPPRVLPKPPVNKSVSENMFV